MEISVKKEIFHIQEDQINGFYGVSSEDVISILSFKKENLKINQKVLAKKEQILLKKEIQILEKNSQPDNYYKTIYEWFYDTILKNNLYPKNIEKKINDSIRIVGLKEDILNLGYLEVSDSERKLLQIARILLKNPEIIILEEPFLHLDRQNQKKIYILLQKLVQKYGKIVIILSTDEESLFHYTEHLILWKKDKVIAEGATKKVYQQVELLQKHKIEVPEIIEFTYLVQKNKNIKIDYYDDIRDIIKDIYKHIKR